MKLKSKKRKQISEEKKKFDDQNYILCPDKTCNLFYDTSQPLLCEKHCPKPNEMNIMIKCCHCRKEILLEHGHCSWRRVDCECGACNFHRMSGKFELVRKK